MFSPHCSSINHLLLVIYTFIGCIVSQTSCFPMLHPSKLGKFGFLAPTCFSNNLKKSVKTSTRTYFSATPIPSSSSTSRNIHSTSNILNHLDTAGPSFQSTTPITANENQYFTTEHYRTLNSLSICGAHMEIVQAPDNIETLLPNYNPDNLGEILMEELQSIDQVSNSSMSNMNDFIAGRVALRRCFGHFCDDISWEETMKPMLRKPGPTPLPKGWIGSISHKNGTAIAALRRADGWSDQIGVDIEKLSYSSRNERRFQERILTSYELEKLPSIKGLSELQTSLLRFSMKESIFKAIYPCLKRMVGHKEVEVFPSPDGTAEVRFKLNKDSLKYQGYKAEWLTYDDKFFITAFYLCKDM